MMSLIYDFGTRICFLSRNHILIVHSKEKGMSNFQILVIYHSYFAINMDSFVTLSEPE